MSRRARQPVNPHFWVCVRVALYCALGGHQVAAGQWVRYRRGDYRKLASCEACLKPAGIVRPARKFTSVGDKPDYRAARSGDE